MFKSEDEAIEWGLWMRGTDRETEFNRLTDSLVEFIDYFFDKEEDDYVNFEIPVVFYDMAKEKLNAAGYRVEVYDTQPRKRNIWGGDTHSIDIMYNLTEITR